MLLLLVASILTPQSDPGTIDRIIDEGKNRSQVMRTLHELCFDVGPRVLGSPELDHAEAWAMAKFTGWGLKNVHLEKWGEIPVGFERGPHQIGRMIEPYATDLTFTTMNWMPGTHGPVKADAAWAPQDVAEINATPGKFRGKWIICRDKVSMRGAQSKETPEYREALDHVGIAGRIYGCPSDLVHSHGTFKDKTYEHHPTGVEIDVAKSDFDRIARNLDFGRRVTLEFDLDNRWIKGPLPTYDVVAEIPGTEKPDECVIVGGHLDSWNTPGSQGACDNGTGVSTAMEAARILATVGAKPRRTIRFILYTGEEEGLLGSFGYVENHKADLAKISAVLNDDGGTNYQGGYWGQEQYKSIMEAAYAPTAKAFPEMPMKFEVVKSMTGDMGSDHAPFNLAGVPGFDTLEEGRADYLHIWHTQFDRYDQAIPEYLVQSGTNHAVVAFNLANLPNLLPRVIPADPDKE